MEAKGLSNWTLRPVLISISPEPVRMPWKWLAMTEDVCAKVPSTAAAAPASLPSWRSPESASRESRDFTALKLAPERSAPAVRRKDHDWVLAGRAELLAINIA